VVEAAIEAIEAVVIVEANQGRDGEAVATVDARPQ
jgi:hypothetical protein